MHGFEKIHACFVVKHTIAVQAILILIRFDRKVAIFGITALIQKVAVLYVHNIECQFWNDKKQIRKLIEERLGEVVWPPELFRIPLIGVPRLMEVDFVGRIRGILRQNWFSREITFPHVEISLDSPCESPLQAALGAERWFWYLHLVIEAAITVSNRE